MLGGLMEVVIGKGKSANSQHFCLGESEVLKVLGPSPRTIAFKPKQTKGCRLLVALAETVPVDTAVRIDHDDAFVLGEVTGCWEAAGAVLAVVELSQYHPLSSAKAADQPEALVATPTVLRAAMGAGRR
jgi:hypothetical protein